MMRSIFPGRLVSLPLAIALLCLLTGCLGQALDRPAPERRFYAIAAARPESAPRAKDKTVLKVRPLRVSPAYQDRDMVYRMDEARYVSDYYNAFFVQPATALSQLTQEWLGRSGIFGNVVNSASLVADTHQLEGMINAIYADFRDPANPKAVIEAQFFLLKNKNEDYSVIFSKDYRREIPFAQGSNGAGLAEAYGKAFTEILGELEADLRTVKR